MNENLDDLIKTIDRVFDAHCGRVTRDEAEQGSWPTLLWTSLKEIGITSAMLDESQGGSELDLASGMLLLRRCAYHAAPIPLAETYLAGRLLTAAGMLIPDGILTVAPMVGDYSIDPVGSRFTGAVRAVPWGGRADYVVVPAVVDGRAKLVLLSPHQGDHQVNLNIAAEPRVDIRFDGATVHASSECPNASERLHVEGALYRAVQMAGALERILEYSLQYANERVQFGRPIGKFQAVQQMLAVMAGQVAAASAAVDMAVEAAEEQVNELAVAIAKSRVGEAAGKSSEIAHQVHGAMGFTREHSLHYSTRRLWAWRDEFGGETYWQTRLGRLIAAHGADAVWPTLTSITA